MFQPKNEQELQNSMCWPAGVYDFEVVDAVVGESKKGAPMLSLSLKVFDPNSERNWKVKDWLVESDAAVCLMKMRHYCATTGDMGAYESGSIENFPGIGATGKCKLAIEQNDRFGAQNKVADYIKPVVEEKPSLGGVPMSQTKRANDAFNEIAQDDDCPF